MARWRFPTLSIHGIEGAFSDPGAKTVLPRRVSGKFSIRQVPNMTSPVVWKSSSGQRRVDGAESPRHRADATEHASMAWGVRNSISTRSARTGELVTSYLGVRGGAGVQIRLEVKMVHGGSAGITDRPS